MKLIRFGEEGHERPGLIDTTGVIRDLSSRIDDICGPVLAPEMLDELRRLDLQSLPEVDGDCRLGPPVSAVGKIICVGLNYIEHAEESAMDVPAEPVLFTKAVTAITGAFDAVVLPKGATQADWEVELVAVIGSRASYVDQEEAMKYVAGFCLGNDISERAFQLNGTGQWLKGKSADTFAPIGPWLVTTDEVDGCEPLNIWLEVDGVRQQDSSTGNMIFGVADIVAYVSRFMTLLPGDLIFTGTPAGTALGQTSPVWLQPGALLRCGITGLGEQNQTVIAWEHQE